MKPQGVVDRLILAIESRWGSIFILIMRLLALSASFALPAWAAWAVTATEMFSEWAPLSWVIAGFGGTLAYALFVTLYGFGRGRIVQSRYDEKVLAETGRVDPLAKVFERKRIFLNDFILPSSPVIIDRLFVDCDIVGPANIFLSIDNTISHGKSGKVDAVALSAGSKFLNGFVFNSCTFRGCAFHRITIFFSNSEVGPHLDLNWLNWISELPAQNNLQLEGASAPNVEASPPQQSDGQKSGH